MTIRHFPSLKSCGAGVPRHYDPEMKDNAVSEADILWTLRGGFPTGVVTELTLRAYPAGKPFLMGKLQCMSPAGSETKSREMLEGLLEPIATSDATVQLKARGETLFVFKSTTSPKIRLRNISVKRIRAKTESICSSAAFGKVSW